MTRQNKIKALKAIQEGTGTIGDLMEGDIWEFWNGTDQEPDIFNNEATGERLTASQLKDRQQARPYLKFFETIKCYT